MTEAASIGIVPKEFWAMTPWELFLTFEGAGKRRSQFLETLAHFFAALMSMWAAKGKRVKPTDLYRPPSSGPEFLSTKEFTEYMRRKKERAEAKELEGDL